jgi:hypothetical protein
MRDIACRVDQPMPRRALAPIATALAAIFAVLLALARGAAAESPAPAPYVGQWYLSFPEVCAGAPEETDGLLTYTAREFIGLENRCRVERARPRDGGTELVMRCLGEGHPYRTREIVKVVNGRLHRTMRDEGKWQTYTYERCPEKAK